MRTRILSGLLLTLFVSACELHEITIADADDVVVAEIVLRAGASVQTAYLHRTSSEQGSGRVPDAFIVVTEETTGTQFAFNTAADSVCLANQPVVPAPGTGSCYVARGDSRMVQPGERYTLVITLDDGREMTGVTEVPHTFVLNKPQFRTCRLPARTKLDLEWTTAEGAAIYIISTRMFGLRQALRETGVQVPGNDPVDLVGLSVTAADTTMSFPDELGLFNRFDDDVHPILIALRAGLPFGVRVVGVVAATDRNYVNWIRGGTFNPSGVVRIPSIHGDGYGVFGSLTLEDFEIRSTGQSSLPPCQ
jgi:hypothetical protein